MPPKQWNSYAKAVCQREKEVLFPPLLPLAAALRAAQPPAQLAAVPLAQLELFRIDFQHRGALRLN